MNMETFTKSMLFILCMSWSSSSKFGLDNIISPLLDIQFDYFVKLLYSMDFEKIGSDINSEKIDLILRSLEANNEELYMSGLELLTKYGFNYEEHWVQTKDGYLLKLVRIPRNGPAILVGHGLFCSFVDFITPGPDSGLTSLLANADYDVWMINFRGNTYSRNHTSLSPKDKTFWNFSWHEMGTLDLPATIDFILNTTGQTQLFYIGHSQGTTSVLVLMSELPEYNSKLKLVMLLSPVAFMDKIKSPLVRMLSHFQDVEYLILKALGMYEFLPEGKFLKTMQHLMCPTNPVTNYVCSNIVFLLCGFDEDQVNETYFPSEFYHSPSGAATKQMIHYVQEVKSGQFRQFDYGLIENLQKYRNAIPPDYNLSQIAAPVALYYASNDWLSDLENVKILADRLPNVAEQYLVPFEKFNHMDFVWGKDVVPLLYSKVLKLMEHF